MKVKVKATAQENRPEYSQYRLECTERKSKVASTAVAMPVAAGSDFSAQASMSAFPVGRWEAEGREEEPPLSPVMCGAAGTRQRTEHVNLGHPVAKKLCVERQHCWLLEVLRQKGSEAM